MNDRTRVAKRQSPLFAAGQGGHRHAHNMACYASDAKTSPTPWLLWEILVAGTWRPCTGHPAWGEETDYRRAKRSTLAIHVYESSLDGVMYQAMARRLPADRFVNTIVLIYIGGKLMDTQIRETE